MRCVGLILAGGQARRMGGADKARLVLGDRTLIVHVIDRLGPQTDSLLISGHSDYDTGLTVVRDNADGPTGPVAGLLAACQALVYEPETVLVTAPVDTPFLPLDLVTRLCTGDLPAMAHCADRDQPAFTAWTIGRLQARLSGVADTDAPSLGAIARNANARIVAFDDPRAFLNLNTPDDLDAARREFD